MAWYGDGGWDSYPPYVSVGQKKAYGMLALAKLLKKSKRTAEPVVVARSRASRRICSRASNGRVGPLPEEMAPSTAERRTARRTSPLEIDSFSTGMRAPRSGPCSEASKIRSAISSSGNP